MPASSVRLTSYLCCVGVEVLVLVIQRRIVFRQKYRHGLHIEDVKVYLQVLTVKYLDIGAQSKYEN